MSKKPATPTNLGRIIKRFRVVNEITLRPMAESIGISPATLMRIEQGRGTDDETFLKLVNWLMEKPTPKGD